MGVGSPSQVVPRIASGVARRQSRKVPPPPERAAGDRTPRGEPRSAALVGLIMGSRSDWETMQHAADALDVLGVPYEARVVSAHRTPDLLFAYAAEAEGRGIEVLIAGAGGAAHLPGMAAAKTILPVLGVPVQSKALNGMDSLLSIVQMPAGIPVGALAIGRAGAVNAALLATAILGGKHARFRQSLRRYREVMTKSVLDNGDPREQIAEGTFAPPPRAPQKGARSLASPPRPRRDKK